MIVLQIRVHDPSVTMVDFSRLLQRHPNTLHNAADFLAVQGLRIHDLAAGGHFNGARGVDSPPGQV